MVERKNIGLRALRAAGDAKGPDVAGRGNTSEK